MSKAAGLFTTHLCVRERRLWKIHFGLFVVAKPEKINQDDYKNYLGGWSKSAQSNKCSIRFEVNSKIKLRHISSNKYFVAVKHILKKKVT